MDIDAIIAEANASSPAQEPKQADAIKDVESKEVEVENDATEQVETETKKEELFPKKAVNAISRRDKQISRLKFEIQELKKNQEAKEVTKQNPKPEGMPTEEDYANRPYSEYLEAITEWKIEQKLSQGKLKQKEAELEQEEQGYDSERIEAFNENEKEAKKLFSDFDQVAAQALKIPLNPQVRRAFLEADNGVFAYYAMAKEGVLDALNDMSAIKAAMVIARYEDKGLAMSKQKQQTKTPSPISPNKGVGSGSKSLEQKGVDELMKWVKS